MSNKEILLILGAGVAFLWWRKNKSAAATAVNQVTASNFWNTKLSFAPQDLNTKLSNFGL